MTIENVPTDVKRIFLEIGHKLVPQLMLNTIVNRPETHLVWFAGDHLISRLMGDNAIDHNLKIRMIEERPIIIWTVSITDDDNQSHTFNLTFDPEEESEKEMLSALTEQGLYRVILLGDKVRYRKHLTYEIIDRFRDDLGHALGLVSNHNNRE